MRYNHGAGTTSGERTEQENNIKRAGSRQRGGEGGEERKKINVQQCGLKGLVAREGRPPGMARDRQGPRHRMAVGLEESTERNRDRWRCSVVVRACREEGTTRKKHGEKKKTKTRTTPRSTTWRRDRKGHVARAMRRPQGTWTAWEAAQE